ncbi:protein kinase domain-containing protein [Legionella sainthelensi]|uniref:protein kinase domain-containing protein n=1 Tax=Legionella sainthelensi TaxID=28087 RepID=UPI000E200182|nr:protein kinase family protein [Legionella sainthelensi]
MKSKIQKTFYYHTNGQKYQKAPDSTIDLPFDTFLDKNNKLLLLDNNNCPIYVENKEEKICFMDGSSQEMFLDKQGNFYYKIYDLKGKPVYFDTLGAEVSFDSQIDSIAYSPEHQLVRIAIPNLEISKGLCYYAAKKIGEGGFGVIYQLYFEIDLNSSSYLYELVPTVVKKILKTAQSLDEIIAESRRFERSNACIPEKGSERIAMDEHYYYIFSAFLPGTNLLILNNGKRELSPELEPKNWSDFAGSCMAFALQIHRLHEETTLGGSFVHLDIKPDNLRVYKESVNTPDGKKFRIHGFILDFGSSQKLNPGEISTKGSDKVTTNFAARELFFGVNDSMQSEFSTYSDIYSLGVTFKHFFQACHLEEIKHLPIQIKFQTELFLNRMTNVNYFLRPDIEEVLRFFTSLTNIANIIDKEKNQGALFTNTELKRNSKPNVSLQEFVSKHYKLLTNVCNGNWKSNKMKVSSINYSTQDAQDFLRNLAMIGQSLSIAKANQKDKIMVAQSIITAMINKHLSLEEISFLSANLRRPQLTHGKNPYAYLKESQSSSVFFKQKSTLFSNLLDNLRQKALIELSTYEKNKVKVEVTPEILKDLQDLLGKENDTLLDKMLVVRSNLLAYNSNSI